MLGILQNFNLTNNCITCNSEKARAVSAFRQREKLTCDTFILGFTGKKNKSGPCPHLSDLILMAAIPPRSEEHNRSALYREELLPDESSSRSGGNSRCNGGSGDVGDWDRYADWDRKRHD